MVPMQQYLEAQQSYVLALERAYQSHTSDFKEVQQSHTAELKEALHRAQQSRESALERAQQSHTAEMKEAHQSREAALERAQQSRESALEMAQRELRQAEKVYLEENESRRAWQKRYLRVSGNFNIRGALEMLVTSYLFENRSLKLKGIQQVLDHIATEKFFKEKVKSELKERRMDLNDFEKARSALYHLLSKYAHNCEESEVIDLSDENFVKVERAAVICYLRFHNQNGIVIQWKDTKLSKQIEGEE